MHKITKQGDDVLWKTLAYSPFPGAALPVLQAGLNECSVPLLISPDLCYRELIVQTSGRLQTAFLAAGSCAVLHSSGSRQTIIEKNAVKREYALTTSSDS